jgi:hypothetical protein
VQGDGKNIFLFYRPFNIIWSNFCNLWRHSILRHLKFHIILISAKQNFIQFFVLIDFLFVIVCRSTVQRLSQHMLIIRLLTQPVINLRQNRISLTSNVLLQHHPLLKLKHIFQSIQRPLLDIFFLTAKIFIFCLIRSVKL